MLLPDGAYKLVGESKGRFWWVIKNVRFEPGELDPYDPTIRRLPPGARLPLPAAWHPVPLQPTSPAAPRPPVQEPAASAGDPPPRPPGLIS